MFRTSLNNLMVIAGIGLIGCTGVFYTFRNQVSKKLIRSTQLQKVLTEVRNHKGAVHYLGEPIEPIRAKFANLGIEYCGYSEVKVIVQGPKSKGIVFVKMYPDELKDILIVDSIQLQIGVDDTKRLVIKNSTKEINSD